MNKNNKVILFNGPALIGKNSAITYLADCGLNFQFAECKDHLHTLTQNLFCIDEQTYWEIYEDRAAKEKPDVRFKISKNIARQLARSVSTVRDRLEVLDTVNDKNDHIYLSIREAMIYTSEVVCKPAFGKEYFGRARALKIKNDATFNWIWVDSSCGFNEELIPLVETLGQENILLIRIHKTGYTFAGDSRRYINDGVIINTVDVTNNGSEREYNSKIYELVTEFIRD